MPPAANNRAVFLDRDGTIIEDTGYPSGGDAMKMLPGVPDAIATLNQAGFKVIVITNQSGIGRGYFDEQAVDEFHAILKDLLALSGARIDAYYFCPHAPDENGNPVCNCRKPRTGLLQSAELDHGLDLELSFLVGDNPSDIEAGKIAGCTAIQLAPEKVMSAAESVLPNHVAPNLPMAVDWIMIQETINNSCNRSPKEPSSKKR